MLRPFSKFCVGIGAIPPSMIQSLSYQEQLWMLIKFLRDTVIPAIEGNTEAIRAIENWIQNVDLQEFIDHKLDEMAESGELQEIISEYLNSIAVFGFDTVDDMIHAENLINGSYARTCGSLTFNDGNSALYKIRTVTNDDTVDGTYIVAMETDDTLVAEKILEYLGFVTVGVKNCDYTTVNGAVAYAKTVATNATPVTIFIMGGTYNEELDMRNCHGISLIGYGNVKITHASTYPMSPLYVSGDCNFTNIHFYNNGEHTYALHLDPSTSGVQGTCKFYNCIFEVGAVSTATVGIGLHQGTHIIFDHCKIINSTNAPFMCHTSAVGNETNCEVTVRYCEFLGKNNRNTPITIINDSHQAGYDSGEYKFHFIGNYGETEPLVMYKREPDYYLGYIPANDYGVKLRGDSTGNTFTGLNYDYNSYSNANFLVYKPATTQSSYYYYFVPFENADKYNVEIRAVNDTYPTASITGAEVVYTTIAGVLIKDQDSTGAGHTIQVRLKLTPANSNYDNL